MHYLTCTVEHPALYRLSLYFWYIFSWGRDISQVKPESNAANEGSWLAMSYLDSKASLYSLNSVVCMQFKTPSSIAIVRKSSSYDGYAVWTESQI